jgi:signal transduction histidine kinase/CheY-like chemotaxis protein/HAMP domain-containing protein
MPEGPASTTPWWCPCKQSRAAGTAPRQSQPNARGSPRRRRSDSFALVRRLSIARSLRLALLGLSVALAVVAALGVAALYNARQHYEDEQGRAYELQVAGSNLLAAGVVEEAILRQGDVPGAAAAERRAVAAFRNAAAQAVTLARGDGPSARLVAQQVAAQAQARAAASSSARRAQADPLAGPLGRARNAAAQLTQRQVLRRQAARSKARHDSRRALLAIIVGAVLALAAALALVAALISAMRRPLDALVDATQGLAAGDLERRVDPAGPSELQELGRAFNAMTSDLARAQSRIEEERRHLAVTIESLGDALLVCDAEGRVTAANPRAAVLVPDVGVGDDLAAANGLLPPLEDAVRGEVSVRQGERTLAVTAAPLGGEDDGVVWTIRDVSERARLERLKSEFVATASHELRSPLTSIKGFVELLEHSPGLSERQGSWIEIVRRSTDRLVDLVNDLLDVARIEADSVELHRRAVDLSEVLEELAELMGPRLADKEQTLELELRTLPPAMVDPARVRQVFANLLTNAHLYTGRGGKIVVRGRVDGSDLVIDVSDTGRGMSPLEVEQVFERFYRAGGEGADGSGTGLGLSIVKSLVDLHGGAIEVESEPGVGTTFSVRLPRSLAAEELGPARQAMRGKRILVVDDEADIAQLIADQLAPLEVETTVVQTGREALEELRRGDYDAVTLDILMPGMSGFEVLAAIRAEAALRRTPVVFVTVFSGRERLKDEWVVKKPIDADELTEVLASAVRAGRTHVLVVARPEIRERIVPALDALGIDHEWQPNGPAAALACHERRFEVALVDAGLRNPRAVVRALDLRGRRLRQAVIVFAPEDAEGAADLGVLAVPVEDAAGAVVAALRAE